MKFEFKAFTLMALICMCLSPALGADHLTYVQQGAFTCDSYGWLSDPTNSRAKCVPELLSAGRVTVMEADKKFAFVCRPLRSDLGIYPYCSFALTSSIVDAAGHPIDARILSREAARHTMQDVRSLPAQ